MRFRLNTWSNWLSIKDIKQYDLPRDKKKCYVSTAYFFQTLDMCVNIELALFAKHQDDCVSFMPVDNQHFSCCLSLTCMSFLWMTASPWLLKTRFYSTVSISVSQNIDFSSKIFGCLVLMLSLKCQILNFYRLLSSFDNSLTSLTLCF